MLKSTFGFKSYIIHPYFLIFKNYTSKKKQTYFKEHYGCLLSKSRKSAAVSNEAG